jgi:hypothetical protein
MKTSADRLRWVIDFAQIDYEYVLKEWEWLKIKDEIIQFVGLGFDRDYPYILNLERHTHKPEDLLTKERTAQLQHHVNDYLTSWASTHLVVAEPVITESQVPASMRKLKTKAIEIRHWITLGRSQVAFNPYHRKWGFFSRFLDLFFIRLGLVIIDEGTNRIQHCLECGRMFYRVRKQVYCSKTCINRVSRRKWLENPKNRKKERQWARERYERRVKEKTHGNVKVQSRSRKGGKG